jgi:hypothetical protein
MDRFFRVAGRESRPAQPPARGALSRGSGGAVSEHAEGEVANRFAQDFPAFPAPDFGGEWKTRSAVSHPLQNLQACTTFNRSVWGRGIEPRRRHFLLVVKCAERPSRTRLSRVGRGARMTRGEHLRTVPLIIRRPRAKKRGAVEPPNSRNVNGFA